MLLLSSPEIGQRLVDVWLGPVLALPRAEASALVDTLVAWVECGGSATRTAERVPCHRNTVLNRLRRVGDLTGRPLDEATPPVDLVLALSAHDLGLAEVPDLDGRGR
jgi:DNA-binding PucR family transcriptional regulator